VFWLELPLIASKTVTALPAAHAPDVPHDQGASVAGRAPRLLVVDDVAMNRDIAGAFLLATGHEVAYAEGGLEAVAAVATMDFDLVLMDVRMPEVDGLEATRRIRALGGVRGGVPIVAMTAQAFTEQVRECRKAGMDGHVTKPFTPEMLRDAVVRGIEAAGLRRDAIGSVSRLPTAPAATFAFGLELPVLDVEEFERTAAFLTPEVVARSLRTIAERCVALQRGLRAPDAVARAGTRLADAAHALAGSAGMFGFERLAAAARGFERAVQTGAEEVPGLAHNLNAALETASAKIRKIFCDI
jgi:CheY-like chemotaxis protein